MPRPNPTSDELEELADEIIKDVERLATIVRKAQNISWHFNRPYWTLNHIDLKKIKAAKRKAIGSNRGDFYSVSNMTPKELEKFLKKNLTQLRKVKTQMSELTERIPDIESLLKDIKSVMAGVSVPPPKEQKPKKVKVNNRLSFLLRNKHERSKRTVGTEDGQPVSGDLP